jgi:hypothetical protein
LKTFLPLASGESFVREATDWFFFGGTSRQRKREFLCVLRASVVNKYSEKFSAHFA